MSAGEWPTAEMKQVAEWLRAYFELYPAAADEGLGLPYPTEFLEWSETVLWPAVNTATEGGLERLAPRDTVSGRARWFVALGMAGASLRYGAGPDDHDGAGGPS